MFGAISDSFKNAINKIRFQDDGKALKKALDTLKKSLLKADVHHKVVKQLLFQVEKDTLSKGVGKNSFVNALKNNLTQTLEVEGKKSKGFVFAPSGVTTVLMVGLQGSGKTTSTVKIAYSLKLKKKKVLVAACDLQRLAAVEQLKQLCATHEIDLYFEENETNPIKIAQNAKKEAQQKLYDVLIVDTAGRLAIDDELMGEITDVKKAINPDEVFYVADALTGQDAIRSATTFNAKLALTGVVLSKFDGDSKGGVAFGIANLVGVLLRYIGTGEKIPDLEIFIPERIVNRVMGEGDIEGLSERITDVIDEKEAKKISKKIKKGQFSFNDFLSQLESLKKMGSMKSLLGMIPGMGAMKEQLANLDLDNSDEIKSIKAMIGSMTKKEKEEPELLLKNSSRKRRISHGCGMEIHEVNRFLKQFKGASKMAKKMSGGSMKDMKKMMASMQGGAGMPPMG